MYILCNYFDPYLKFKYIAHETLLSSDPGRQNINEESDRFLSGVLGWSFDIIILGFQTGQKLHKHEIDLIAVP